ncbi:MAG: DUF2156 domain-containing protein [Oscillospiraceae bacterium]|nr:DUF2156 domain-containing protein [Oscillospiraceae bacterium]
MLEFYDISMDDQQWVTACLRASDYRGCEYSFANNMAWRRLHESKIARFAGFYLCCAFDTEDGVPSFVYPAGEGDHRELIAEMKRFSEAMGKPLRIWNLSPARLAWMEATYPDAFTAEAERDSWDYIYNSEDLHHLRGRKYHQKRNFLHRFAEYGAVSAPLTERDFDDCITFAAQSYADKLEGDRSGISEQFAIDTYFRHFDALGLEGTVLRLDGRLAAFAIGEPLSSDTFCVHIEKADTTLQGAYAAVNQAFAAAVSARFPYINREEDLGLEGLRKAKLSYRPAFMQEKYCVTFK